MTVTLVKNTVCTITLEADAEEKLNLGGLTIKCGKEGDITLTPVGLGDKEAYVKLFGDKLTMEHYIRGTRDAAWCEARLRLWEKRWKTGNPYAGLKISKAGEVIGHLVYGGASEQDIPVGEDIAKWGEVALVIHHSYQRQGVGSSVMDALRNWAAYLIENEHELLESGALSVPAKTGVVATLSPLNEPNLKLAAHYVALPPKLRAEASDPADHRLLFQGSIQKEPTEEEKSKAFAETAKIVERWRDKYLPKGMQCH